MLEHEIEEAEQKVVGLRIQLQILRAEGHITDVTYKLFNHTLQELLDFIRMVKPVPKHEFEHEHEA
jgi:hypothetical protein